MKMTDIFFRRALQTGAILVALSFVSVSANATDIAKFFGHFEGSGISENADSLYFAVTVRDMDVRIAPSSDGGFTLTWTTITRKGGDPNNPKVKRKSTSLTFGPDEVPGVYRAPVDGNVVDGAPVWWSRVDGNSLYTYMLKIEQDGTWQSQKYERTLSGQGMTLVFQRIVDGKDLREVKGRLVKTGN